MILPTQLLLPMTNVHHSFQRKHLREFQSMMAASKLSERARRQASDVRRLAKEQAASATLSIWEKAILPNWKAVLRDEKLKAIWWGGTMPPRHRARLWQGCIGNGLALGKGRLLVFH